MIIRGGTNFQTKSAILLDGHFVIANQQTYGEYDFVRNKDLSLKKPITEVTNVKLQLAFDKGNIPYAVDLNNYQMRITNVRSKNEDTLVVGKTYSCKHTHVINIKSDTDFDYVIELLPDAFAPIITVDYLLLYNKTFEYWYDKYTVNLNLLDDCPDLVSCTIFLVKSVIIQNYHLILKFYVSPGTGNLNLNKTFLKLGLIETGGFNSYETDDMFYCNNIHDLECKSDTTFYFSLGDNDGNKVELDYALLDNQRITGNKVKLPAFGYDSTLEVFIKGTW